MKKIIPFIYRAFLPQGVKHRVDIFKHFRTIIQMKFCENRVLVLSPHQDDDVIGCGGTLHMYHRKGTKITTVYMTDGRKGSSKVDESLLVSQRRVEADRAARIIGVNRTIFLKNRDTELAVNVKNIEEMSHILGETEPEAVFLPIFLDDHNDHAVTCDIFMKAGEAYSKMKCYFYSVWYPLPRYNCWVDITDIIEIKKKALEANRSQCEEFDLVGASMGMNKYYGLTTGSNKGYGWAEVFLAIPFDEFKRFMRAIRV